MDASSQPAVELPLAEPAISLAQGVRRPPPQRLPSATRISIRTEAGVAAAALAVVLVETGLLAPGSPLLRVTGALTVAAIGLALVYLVDGLASNAYWSVAELVRSFTAAALLSGAAAVALAWRWPDVFSPLLAVGLVAGIALAGKLLARSALVPAATRARNEKVRALVIGQPASADLEKLTERVEVAGRMALSEGLGSLGRALSLHKPHVVLVEESLSELDFEFLCTCWEHGAPVLALPRPSYGPTLGTGILRLGGFPWVPLRPVGLAHRHLRAKRALDLALIALTAPVVLAVLAVIAVAIRTTSRGGVLYRQARLGEHGRTFVLLKFRTMRHDAERETGPVLAQPRDPRMTRVGRFLREARLDELPQLWNVVRGEMSLVGPRPERPELAVRFREIPGYDCRLLLRPGLTGLAQLVGGYAASAEDKLRCDLLYLTGRSLRVDLRLIGRTAFELLRGFPVV